MTSQAFNACAKLVLAEEGGYVDHDRDPGGKTNLGITHRTLAHARHVIDGLPVRVADLTRREALQIYYALYWLAIRGDELPLPLALVAFDAAVNQGPPDAVRFLQLAVGVPADGLFGPKTMAAVEQAALMPALTELGARRMHDYMLLDELDDTFGLGWSRRLVRILASAIQLIRVPA